MENTPQNTTEDTPQINQEPKPEQSNAKTSFSKPLIISLLILIVILLGVIGYLSLINTRDEDIVPPATMPSQAMEKEETTPTSSPSATPNIQADDETIQSAIESKNYAALEQEMADTISVTLYASECCGLVTKTQAIKQLDYLSQATAPWIWDQDNAIIQQIKTAQPTTFGKGTIGISNNKYVLSYEVTEDKISAIYISASYELLIP